MGRLSLGGFPLLFVLAFATFTDVGGTASSARTPFNSLSVDVSTNLIVDGYGRVRLFHGVNAVEKEAPYLPVIEGFNTENSLTKADAALLQSWGLNMVRLGVMWPAVMPQEGVVNTTYLELVKATVLMLESSNIFTLIDLHQDVLSPYLCGEGMPDWAFWRALELVGFDNSSSSLAFPAPLPFSIPKDATGKPDIDACQNHSFFEYYMSLESEAAWHAIYSQPEVWDMMADHWGAVAEHLSGLPGLLGYELLNEPWPSRGANDSWHVLSDSQTLLPLYQKLHDRIRAVDPDTLVFFEPLVFESYESVLHRYSDFPAGGPGGPEYADRSVFAYHSYCPSAPDGAPSSMRVCKPLVRSAWNGVAKNLENLGVGGFLTEFGAVGEDEDSLELIRLQTEGADRLFQGWSYWTYKSFDDITTQNSATEIFFNEDGSLQDDKVKALARSYAPVIAGTPNSMTFDSSDGTFYLKYTVNFAVTLPSSTIYLNTGYYYPHGFQVTIAGATWTIAQSTADWTVLVVTHDMKQTKPGETVSVRIDAKTRAEGKRQ